MMTSNVNIKNLYLRCHPYERLPSTQDGLIKKYTDYLKALATQGNTEAQSEMKSHARKRRCTGNRHLSSRASYNRLFSRYAWCLSIIYMTQEQVHHPHFVVWPSLDPTYVHYKGNETSTELRPVQHGFFISSTTENTLATAWSVATERILCYLTFNDTYTLGYVLCTNHQLNLLGCKLMGYAAMNLIHAGATRFFWPYKCTSMIPLSLSTTLQHINDEKIKLPAVLLVDRRALQELMLHIQHKDAHVRVMMVDVHQWVYTRDWQLRLPETAVQALHRCLLMEGRPQIALNANDALATYMSDFFDTWLAQRKKDRNAMRWDQLMEADCNTTRCMVRSIAAMTQTIDYACIQQRRHAIHNAIELQSNVLMALNVGRDGHFFTKYKMAWAMLYQARVLNRAYCYHCLCVYERRLYYVDTVDVHAYRTGELPFASWRDRIHHRTLCQWCIAHCEDVVKVQQSLHEMYFIWERFEKYVCRFSNVTYVHRSILDCLEWECIQLASKWTRIQKASWDAQCNAIVTQQVHFETPHAMHCQLYVYFCMYFIKEKTRLNALYKGIYLAATRNASQWMLYILRDAQDPTWMDVIVHDGAIRQGEKPYHVHYNESLMKWMMHLYSPFEKEG